MNTTNMAQSRATHKPRDVKREHSQSARQAPFQSSAQTREMLSPIQPRKPSQPKQDGGMSPCEILFDAAADARLSNLDFRLLAFFLRDYAVAPTRREIAEMAGCSMSSIPRAARKLEGLGYIQRGKSDPKAKAYPTRYSIPQDTRIVEDTGKSIAQDMAQDVGDRCPKQSPDTEARILGDTVSAPPPITPSKNITLTSQVEPLPANVEDCSSRGMGEELFPDAPKAKRSTAKRRPRRAKFYAAEDTMPSEPNPEMVAYAAEHGMRNGTLAEQHGKFRRWHIRERTLIASLEQRWETWVDNWKTRNPTKPDGAPPGYKFAGVGADGKKRYVKDNRSNFYRG